MYAPNSPTSKPPRVNGSSENTGGDPPLTALSRLPLLLSLLLLATGCDVNLDSESAGDTTGSWLIPQEEVISGGPPKDGIPSIDDPQFEQAERTGYVGENRLITSIRIGGEIRAFPHQVMDHHEIANDAIGQTAYCMTYCPLTGTAVAWDRTISFDNTVDGDRNEGEIAEYGVSGLLFRNNLIPYDRITDTHYSQMQMRGVNGVREGTALNTYPLVQTTWSTWKEMYPESQVLTTDTGFERNYQGFLYGSRYSEEHTSPLFPVKHSDDRLPPKKRVHGILADRPADSDTDVTVYVIDRFAEGIELIRDRVGGEDVVIVGSSGKNLAVSFHPRLEDGTALQLEPVQDALPVVMEDQEGNRWDAFGYAVEGPRQGSRLTPTDSYNGYWFAWADFFPEPDIYSAEK